MRTIQINKFMYVAGGADRYFLELSSLLTKEGHEIANFAVSDKRNISTKFSRYFPPKASLNTPSLRNIIRVLYSIDARNNLIRLLNVFQPDIAHIHNIYHHLTPSILPELHKKGIPIVQTVGDYHLVSPNYFMFHDGHICEITKPDKYYKAVLDKCVKRSYLKSVLEVVEKYLYQKLHWERDLIDMFIVPSKFMEKKLKEYGILEKKVITLPHFIDIDKYKPDYNLGKYILYFGRLSEEKGLKVLLNAMKLLPDIKLVIAGEGPQEKELRIMNYELRNNNVNFVGYKSGVKLKNLIKNCRFTVLPSVWYEVFGLSILESFACGKPVVASNIGGIPEVIDNGVNGLLVKPDNVSELVDNIDNLWNSSTNVINMGKSGRNKTQNKYNTVIHYQQIMQIYEKLL